MSDRPILSGRVDEDTRDRWKAFARYHHVNVSALLEAMGRHLPESGERPPAWLQRVISEAHRVEDERAEREPED